MGVAQVAGRTFCENQRVGVFKLGREMARRKRQYPGPWKLGENLAEDRFETLPGEDRTWSLAMVDDYLREVAQDAVMLVEGTARRQQGMTMDTAALSTVGIACGLHIEEAVKRYINSGAAAGDMRAIAEHRADYDRGREMAETSFFPEPEAWLALAPAIGDGIELRMDDIGIAGAFGFNAFSPPFGEPGVAKSAYMARMAELIRHYLTDDQEELRIRSEKAAAERAEHKKVSKEVEAEYRAKGNHSGAEMIAETNRRMAKLAAPDEERPPRPDNEPGSES